jgi:hypothetical protein
LDLLSLYAWDYAMGIQPAGSLVGVEDLRDDLFLV